MGLILFLADDGRHSSPGSEDVHATDPQMSWRRQTASIWIEFQPRWGRVLGRWCSPTSEAPLIEGRGEALRPHGNSNIYSNAAELHRVSKRKRGQMLCCRLNTCQTLAQPR